MSLGVRLPSRCAWVDRTAADTGQPATGTHIVGDGLGLGRGLREGVGEWVLGEGRGAKVAGCGVLAGAGWRGEGLLDGSGAGNSCCNLLLGQSASAAQSAINSRRVCLSAVSCRDKICCRRSCAYLVPEACSRVRCSCNCRFWCARVDSCDCCHSSRPTIAMTMTAVR